MMSEYSDFQTVLEQVQLFRLFFGRPAVQVQLSLFVIALLAAWLVSAGIWKLSSKRLTAWEKRFTTDNWQRIWRYGLLLLHYLLFPILWFLMLTGSLQSLMTYGWSTVLLVRLGTLLWWMLFYRIGVAVLYMLLGDDYMRRYHPLLLTPLFTMALIVWVFSQFADVTILMRWVIWRPFDKPITLGSLFTAPITFYFLFYTSQAIQDLLQGIIVPRTGADPSVIQAVLTLSRYVVIIVGISIIAISLGANMSTLAFISGGLSVGIGFGLQQIVANFVSGIILLFERTLHPGDVVDVNGEMGVVERLSIRATTMRTPNNIKVIIPNENLLNSSVTTYTRRNRYVRALIVVGVSYQSDPHVVQDLLIATALSHEVVRKEPKPVVLFKDFGESSLDFQLAVWIDDPLQMFRICSELRMMIWDAFAERGIEIPFPQQDLHIRSGVPWEALVGKENKESA